MRWDLVAALCATVSLAACDRPEGGGSAAPASAAASAKPATAATRAVITLDSDHDTMSRKEANAYTIAPASELALEGAPFKSGPDTVHVVRASGGYWRASVSGKQIVLSTGSLDPVKGGPFPGFEAGEHYILAVGVEAPSADGAMRFTPVWSGKVNVRAP